MKTIDGKEYNQKINVDVYKKQQYINIDFGESMEVDVPDEVEAIGGTKLKLKLSELFGDVIPIEYELSDDGTIKGTIGLNIINESKETMHLEQ